MSFPWSRWRLIQPPYQVLSRLLRPNLVLREISSDILTKLRNVKKGINLYSSASLISLPSSVSHLDWIPLVRSSCDDFHSLQGTWKLFIAPATLFCKSFTFSQTGASGLMCAQPMLVSAFGGYHDLVERLTTGQKVLSVLKVPLLYSNSNVTLLSFCASDVIERRRSLNDLRFRHKCMDVAAGRLRHQLTLENKIIVKVSLSSLFFLGCADKADFSHSSHRCFVPLTTVVFE